MLRDKLYTWKKTKKDPTIGKEEEFISAQPTVTPSVQLGKLSGVSFNLETRAGESKIRSRPLKSGIEKKED